MNTDTDLEKNKERIKSIIEEESLRFAKTIKDGTRKLDKIISTGNITSQDAFILFSTYGFPFEMTKEIAKEKGIKVDEKVFEEEFKKHQEKSRTASEGKFKGGLASTGEQEVKFHTATHLLHAALRNVLGAYCIA